MKKEKLKCVCEDCDFEWLEDMKGWTSRFIYCPRCGNEHKVK